MQTSISVPTGAENAVTSVCLERLHLRNFRNFRDQRCEFPPAGAMIVGPNGAGKSNLLEAIYYLEIFRSFRGAPDRELVRFDQDVFRIEAGLSGEAGPSKLAAAFERSSRRKQVEIDGSQVERIADALGAFSAVVFELDDAELVSGAPGKRRRFLDILLSLVSPGYLETLQRYRAALGQRNEALKAGRTKVVDAWTDGLIAPGARMMAERSDWVRRRSLGFRAYHTAISGGAVASLDYESGLSSRRDAGPGVDAGGEEAGDAGNWAEMFRGRLAATRDRDSRRGFTTVGPHRDDLVIRAQIESDGPERDLRTYGSGGQKRTAAIALRLVEADSLRDDRGHEPVYLLDDVFAELDEERATRVFQLLEEGRQGQLFLTAPKPSDMPFRDGAIARWGIRDGCLVEDA
jgi:DNA replication and repair protein RecF